MKKNSGAVRISATLLYVLLLGLPVLFVPAMAQNLSLWPSIQSPVAQSADIEQRISDLVGQMSPEQKVGQIIQAEIKSISPDEVRDFHIGSVLSGGGSFPGDSAHDSNLLWVAAANAFYDASMDTSKGGLAIPLMWGIDAVHGHNNVIGATLFPHNIGLGAANNSDLMRDIGAVTAREVAATGINWVFAPTVAVARDERWGRTYESYAEDPAIVVDLSKELVLGLQGHPALGNFLDGEKVIATAKHFVGDGGTERGDDQGDTVISEQGLFDIHGRGFVPAVGVGIQTVMASFSSWNDSKLHGDKYLLTDVLKTRMGFDGLVLGDWNGHEQLPGCTVTSCAAAINAGIDIIMVPIEWRAFHKNTVRQVKNGEISEARLNDAVRRVLRVKMRAGLFERGRPSDYPLAGRLALIGHPQHREIARKAVRQSLVLLKNDQELLPIDPSKTILVTGSGADSVVMQAGGWSVTWQGTDNKESDFPGATSIYAGLKQKIEASGGIIQKKRDPGRPTNVAIVVFGEKPYAEFEGDLSSLQFSHPDMRLIDRFKAEGIPVVAVFLTGRPLAVSNAIEVSDSFVVAWLPGSEGQGIADLLIAEPDGTPTYDFTGKLPFSWPRDPDQVPMNIGDANYDPLFPFGFGLRYAR